MNVWWQPFLPSILSWWLTLTLLGWLVAPLVVRCAILLPGHGLWAAKLVGLVVTSLTAAWISYVAGRWDWAAPILVRHSALWAVVVVGLVNLRLLWRVYLPLVGFVAEHWRRILWYEAVFFAAFAGYLWFRSYVADATFDARGWWGAEKWANLAILTGLWREGAIPPADPWLAGYSLNYYYFSHWMWATLARLSGVEPQVAFNLALATGFALLVTMAYGVGYALTESRRGAAWALFLVAFAGPPATWSQAPAFARVWSRRGLDEALRAFSFWEPSDVLPNTRNEFPTFNWLLGDLHAHATGLLLLLLAIALLVHLQRAREVEETRWGPLVWSQRVTWLLLVLVMGAMWATNAWDLAVLATLGLLWGLAESWRDGPPGREAAAWAGFAGRTAQVWLLWLGSLVVAIALPAAFYTRATVPPLAQGSRVWSGVPSLLRHVLGAVGRVEAPWRTTLGQWVAFWGMFAVGAAGIGLQRARRSGRLGLNTPLFAALAGCALAAALLPRALSGFPLVGAGLIAVLTACIVGGALAMSRWQMGLSAQWAMVAGATALVCQIVPEFVFLDDPIGPPNERYNTVFKLYYPSWALAGLAVAALLSRGGREESARTNLAEEPSSGESRAKSRRPWDQSVVGGLVLLVALPYPLLGVASRVSAGRDRMARWEAAGLPAEAAHRACRTLDGLAFMDLPSYSSDDLSLGLWMRRALPQARSVAEAEGESYSAGGRMAVISGIPSFLGWVGHQAQWRGTWFSRRVYAARSQDLRTLYTTPDPGEALEVCRKNDLRWVVVGDLERKTYPPLDAAPQEATLAPRDAPLALAKFEAIGRVARRFGNTLLYEIALDNAQPLRESGERRE